MRSSTVVRTMKKKEGICAIKKDLSDLFVVAASVAQRYRKHLSYIRKYENTASRWLKKNNRNLSDLTDVNARALYKIHDEEEIFVQFKVAGKDALIACAGSASRSLG